MWFCFFFSSRRRHTRSKRDWSSDVCSSDLSTHVAGEEELGQFVRRFRQTLQVLHPGTTALRVPRAQREIGRASCRERVEISVVAVSVQKRKTQASDNERRRNSHRLRLTTRY